MVSSGPSPGFQSLFFWMLLSKHEARPDLLTDPNILFQSLFFWMLLSKFKTIQNASVVEVFQSLFFWMLLSKFCRVFPVELCFMFQSLFFWMLLSKVTYTFDTGAGYTGFQSLFFWMLLSKCIALRTRTGASRRGFNPYFSGCFSLRLRNPACFLRKRVLFQSLFFWMLLSKFRPHPLDVFGVRFQSLFFWMLLSKQHVSATMMIQHVRSFNPYFSGCFSLSCN